MKDARPELSGLIAGRYRIQRPIGRGGMATVYLAHDQRHDADVALKVLRPELASGADSERFGREIRITARLQHPNILPVLDSGVVEDNAFYVMPFVDGETLAQRIRREGPLPIEDALSIAAEIADALACAHEAGVVHRDVKPSNIMLSRGHALLADFGIARAIGAAGGEDLTQTGMAIGTLSYMSPEQALGHAIDGRTDIYSLGCVLYEMLAGSPPFTGTPHAILARHSADPVPSLRSVRNATPEAVEQAIAKALAKAPGDRFADATAFRDLLRRETTAQSAALARAAIAPRVGRGRLLTATLFAAAVLGILWVAGSRWTAPGLDPDRILSLPLRVSDGYVGAPSTGEDVATLIISALDGAGGLRWLDGLALLDPDPRDTYRAPTGEEARRLAFASRAGHYVTGSITPTGENLVSVALQLHETATGDLVRTAAHEPVPTAEAWRAGLSAANGLLAQLIGGARDTEREWRDREPGAIASFLRGEAAFRRVHIEEALDHYRDALARDSSFALAAIRGAQAAAWNHRSDQATALIGRASELPLPPRYEDFVRGYSAYLAGDGAEAASALGRTVATYPDMSEAWLQLGEVYTHLLVDGGDPDSLALFALEEARRLDPTATHILPHSIEIRLRRGEADLAEPLLDAFLAAGPDSVVAAKLEIMHRCVRDGPEAVDWIRMAESRPFEVVDAAKSLTAAASQPDCAAAAYRALLAVDTSATDVAADGRRWASVLGLQSLLVSKGRPDEALAAIDAFTARWGYGTTLILLDGTVVPSLAPRARSVAGEIRERYGPYSGWTSAYRLWVVGAFEAVRGDPTEAETIASELASRAATTGESTTGLMERSLRAHIALARRDSTEALRLLDELVPPVSPGDSLTWDEFAPLGLERLALARLLLSRGEYRRALTVAEGFDSASPLIHALFVGASLRLRLEAATRLPDALLVTRLRARLDALER